MQRHQRQVGSNSNSSNGSNSSSCNSKDLGVLLLSLQPRSTSMPGSRSLCRTGAVWCLLVMFLQATVVHPRHICLVNKANNVHTASLFLRKTLEKHGSKNNYSVVLGNKQSPCPADAEARVFLIMPKYLQQLYGSCTGNNLCIVTGDESCFAPTEKWPKSHRTFVIDNPPPEPWLSQMLEEAKNDPCRDVSAWCLSAVVFGQS